LNGNEDGRKLLEKYPSDSNITVTEKDRNSLINNVLGHVINKIGHYYPAASTKDKLNAAIVAAFPQIGLVRDGIPSHAYISTFYKISFYSSSPAFPKSDAKVPLLSDKIKKKKKTLMLNIS
jgi:hypothetical protein